MLKRLDKVGDLFASVFTLQQTLPQSMPQAEVVPVEEALETYRRKRHFSKTAEPVPAASAASTRVSGKDPRRFVIQKHAASHVHYDFRLEMHDVLKSWPVPKGVPYAPGERRLAMATEDHPMDYIDFEGTIPKGQYGGGTVMVSDTFTYDRDRPRRFDSLAGQLSVHLDSRSCRRTFIPVTTPGIVVTLLTLLARTNGPLVRRFGHSVTLMRWVGSV